MGRRVRVWVVLAFVGALFLFVGQTGPPGSPWPGGGQIAPQTAAKEARQPREANPLDGCRHLWLDVGMNIGVQTRKVYEPGLYPDAPALPHLAKFFDGLPKSDICSFGFEPNPDHKRRLDTLEARYRAVGIRIKVFRGAASDKDGETSFYLDRDDPGREWGARIDPMSFQKDKVTVPSIDFASWFARFALTRQIPPSSDPLRDTKPVIAMKLDIEGHDAHVLNPMLRLGLLCKIDLLLLEGVHLQHVQMTWLPGQFKEAIKGCPTRVEDMDDESYGLDGAPWPILGADGQILPRRAKEKWDGHPWPGWAPGVESGGEIVAGKEEGDDKAEEKAGTAEVEAKLATA